MRAFFATAFIFILAVALAPFQILAVLAGTRLARDIPILYHHVGCRAIGLKIHVIGRPVTGRPVLFTCNHVSWLDIPVLGRLIRGSFVAKKEVASWPGFGTLAKLQRTVFVDRARRHQVHKHNSAIEKRLQSGDSLILFPEGTSTDGRHVLPFKTALFGAAEQAASGAGLTVQPVTISYTAINGMPLVRSRRPWLAWYGDMELLPHFWRVLGLGRIEVEVRFHQAVASTDFVSRKELAHYCHDQVAAGNRAVGSGQLALPGR